MLEQSSERTNGSVLLNRCASSDASAHPGVRRRPPTVCKRLPSVERSRHRADRCRGFAGAQGDGWTLRCQSTAVALHEPRRTTARAWCKLPWLSVDAEPDRRCFLTGSAREISEPCLECRVDEEAQSCAPQHGAIVLARREFQDGRDVFGFEVGIIGQDLFPSRASGQEIEHILHTNAKAANARATAANVWTDRDSVNHERMGA